MDRHCHKCGRVIDYGPYKDALGTCRACFSDSLETCRACGVELQGDAIPEEQRHHFGATHFSRIVGESDGDSVGYWRCPDCGYEWPASGPLAREARRNIDKSRENP